MESSKLSDGRSPGNKGARPCKSVSLPDPFTLPVFQRTPVQRSVRAEPCPGVLLRRFTKLREWEILENGPEAYPVILPQSPSRFLHNLLQGIFLFYPAIKRANADSQSAVKAIADQASSTTVQAASGYSGKIYKHWCKLRTAKSKRSKTIKKLSVGTKVTVLSTSGSWRKIKVGNKTGYALKKYVYISTNAPKLTGSTYNKGQTVASFAQRFVGNPYVWGGTNLNTGADCSGFVKSVYKSFGYNLPRSSSSQRSAGRKVSYSNKQPGDLICYSGHIAIYIGNGKIVHASSRKTGIKISPKANYRKVLSVRRIVK